MSLYARVVGHPFVYEHIRPLLVGGIDFSPLYRTLDVGASDVVLDVGCGTGDALNHLGEYARYHGVDVDPIAVEFAQRRWSTRNNTTFEVKLLGSDDVKALAPTKVTLGGVLHHLDDETTRGLLAALSSSGTVQRVASLDIVYLPGRPFANAMAYLDRGRYCRTREGYEKLIASCGWKISSAELVRSHPTRGRVNYLVLAFEMERSPSATT